MTFGKQKISSSCDINCNFFMQEKTYIINKNLQGKTFAIKNIIKLKFFIK